MPKLHQFILWLDAAKLMLKPGHHSIGLDFHPVRGMWEKLDRFFPTLLVHRPPFDFFSVVFLCFTLAFGALHAPSGFDLGQKEIEN